jgi:hypothetical protein
MRKLFGGLLLALGLALTLVIVFYAYDGKYGWRQFTTVFAEGRGDYKLLSFSVVGLAMMVWGGLLMLGRRRSSSGESSGGPTR